MSLATPAIQTIPPLASQPGDLSDGSGLARGLAMGLILSGLLFWLPLVIGVGLV